MDPITPLVLLMGALCGGSVLLLVVALRGTEVKEAAPENRQAMSAVTRRLLLGLFLAAVVLVLTRWVAVSIGLALLTFMWPKLFGGGKEEEFAVARIEALVTWTESLRDMTATGIALPDALPASITAAPALIHDELLALVDRLHDKESLDIALLRFADELNDPTADHIVAALILNVRAQGKQLKAVLTALAESARSELDVRRTVAAERRSSRFAVRIMMGATIVMTFGLFLLNRKYVEPYKSLTGQFILCIVVVLYGAAFVWLRRLSAFKKAERFLRAPAVMRP